MKRSFWSRAAVFALAGIFCIASLSLATAQIKKGKSRALRTKHLMKGVVKPNCDALKKALESRPADDKAWDELGMNAALINEASYILMDDGRCPDGTWADAASKTLRNGSAEVVAAVEKKDLAALKTGFGNMTKSCKSCHDAHKEK